jgi:lipopolysaccharide export system protein LptA
MTLLLALLLACSGPPERAAQGLPEHSELRGVSLRLPAAGLLIEAARAQTEPRLPERGLATEVSAQLEGQPSASIRAEHASWDLREQHVSFEGQVTLQRGPFTLECRRLEARFDSPEQLRSAEALDATIRHRGRVATGQRATLDLVGGSLVLEGAPTVTEGGRSLRGERIVLFLDDERLECERCSLEIAPPAEAP